jgi:uncharacterized protein DUF4136
MRDIRKWFGLQANIRTSRSDGDAAYFVRCASPHVKRSLKSSRVAICVAVMLSLLPFAVCAAEVKSDYDRSFNLSNLRSFKFLDQTQRSAKDALADNELVAKRIQSALQTNLVGLGMEQREPKADFVVVYYAGLRNRAQITTSGRPLWPGGRIWVDQYAEGTAIVEFRGAESGDLIWRGLVTEAVDPNKSEEKINKAIKKLIERFVRDREKQQRTRNHD